MQHTKIPNCLLILLWIYSTNFYQAHSQCATAQGDRVSYGLNSWIGYVYDGVDNYDPANYYGYITETDIFDENFCNFGCSFPTNGCNVYNQTFTVQFKMRKTFPCGTYDLTVGGDDGYRLSIDGGNSYVIDNYTNHPYQTRTVSVTLGGSHDLVLEYYQDGGGDRVTFDFVYSNSNTAGSIDGDQIFCGNSTIDPAEISNFSDANFCGAPFTYQWQSSTDGITFNNIPSTNSSVYDPPIGLTQTTYFRRLATDGSSTLISNVATISVNLPAGDQISYGNNEWIAYYYAARDDYSTPVYAGYSTELESFDQSFCGSDCMQPTIGCDFNTTNFSVRYKMQKNFPCGTYTFTLGGDDGVRLSIDGGATYIIDDYTNHGYRTNDVTVGLDGTYDMVIEYYEAGYSNRVSFTYSLVSTSNGGLIDGDQSFCSFSTVDPSMLGNLNDALICGYTPTYTWQYSNDNITFTDIPSTNSSTFDPSPISQSTYYRRKAVAGPNTVYSNTSFVEVLSTQGDQVTYGQGFWNAYFYEGENNFDPSNYVGYLTFPDIFDESFCGTNCTIATNGCSISSENFSVRLKMNYTLPPGDYQITIGGDDGVRLSVDGGLTYAIDDYSLHPYQTTTDTLTLSGNVSFVFDYYDRSGRNRLSFDIVYIGGVLPVEFTEFTAEQTDDDVVLNWFTESELNNDYFEVLRSNDGINWEKIAQVSGAGTTKEKQTYTYTDEAPKQGENYYQLNQIDYDGSSQLSNIEVVSFASSDQLRLYPNPVGSILNVEGLFDPSDIQVIDALGRQMLTTINTNTSGIQIDVTSLQSGVYYLRIGGNTRSFVKR